MRPEHTGERPLEQLRLPGLALLALALYFLLPFDIRGYMYYLNTRFAHLAAPLVLACVPPVAAPLRRVLLAGAAASALVLAVPLWQGFRAFAEEAAFLPTLAEAVPQRPMVMGLIFDTGSRVVRHPVYLHAAAVIARLQGGAANFSFALTPHSPVKYRALPPPTFPSEWHPEQFDDARMGSAYDTFLIRGVHPARVFGEKLGRELEIAGQAGSAFLVQRR